MDDERIEIARIAWDQARKVAEAAFYSYQAEPTNASYAVWTAAQEITKDRWLRYYKLVHPEEKARRE